MGQDQSGAAHPPGSAALVRPVFPYRLFLAQLLGGDDKYITLAAHEAFHAYQGMLAPGKLSASEITNSQFEGEYPWDDASLQAGWQAELDLLAEALRATDRARTAELARRFLEGRAARRDSAGLSPEFVSYEQQREWLEGLARYAELEIWRQAYEGDYVPLPETASLPNFDDYSGFETRWSQELDQIRRMAGDEGDGRFYYSGMAQAFLLDRLLPDWKERAFKEGVWLEDLLREALESLSGTSFTDSLYLAQDIVHMLRRVGVHTIYSTHTHELASRLAGIPAAAVGTAMLRGARSRALQPLFITAGALIAGVLLLLMTALSLLIMFG